MPIPDVAGTTPRTTSTPKLRNASQVGEANRLVHDAVYAAAAADRFVLTLGGDHSVALGSIAGIARARAGKTRTAVVWVDAHADINTPESTQSGNLHGMPLAFLLRLMSLDGLAGYEWLQGVPRLAPRDLVYIGLRDLDAGEKQAIRALGIKAFTMQDVDRWGIGKVMEMTCDHLLGAGRASAAGTAAAAAAATAQLPTALHLSFDIDAVDPAVAPSTGTAVPGGLSWREAHYVCESCAETGLLRSMDMVEVNPLLAGGSRDNLAGNATVQAAVRFISSALGETILPQETGATATGASTAGAGQ